MVDWSGGTRIGASLKAFNDLWGRRALSRGAVVIIVSDGWERDDTATVAREMARLARCAYSVVWVNPLKGHPDYEPLAGGMRAALPFVDRFLPGAQSVQPGRAGRRPRRHREEACGVKEILDEVERWRENGEKVVVATVVATRRSAPRPVGTSLAVSESGQMCGSVSGGCVESDVYENAREVMETGAPKLLSYGIADEEAWAVGLPCGGEIDVFVERLEE